MSAGIIAKIWKYGLQNGTFTYLPILCNNRVSSLLFQYILKF